MASSTEWLNRYYHVDQILDKPGPRTDEHFMAGEAVKHFLREQCKILVIGAGGLGCEILANLALTGFRDIHVIDMDTIDISNLNRQFLFRPKDVGQPKATVAAEFIMKRVPGVKVTPYHGKIQDKDDDYYMQFNLVICGLDSVEARRWINATLVNLVDEDNPDTVKPLIDGGTEGFKGQARLIIPKVSSCYECSLDMLNKPTAFPICTIANTPRLPEHCIEWASVLEWHRVHGEKKMDTDDPEHISWLYNVAAARAREFKIEGVTWSLTQGVVKNIIPAIASTNAIIAASCCNEAFKIATSSAAYLNNYFMLIGTESVYSYTFEHERREDCPVCGGESLEIAISREWTVERLIELLVERQDIQVKKPSLSTATKHIYFQAPPQLEEATRPNLEKKVSELVEDEDEITVTAFTLPFSLTLRVKSIIMVLDSIKAKLGLQKDASLHKFWATQPVPQLGDEPTADDGYIEPPIPPEQERQEPYPLPKDFEWSTLDISDTKQSKEIYDLLSLNYVEDGEASLRFQYSAEFLQWALMPPGYYKEWHIGVRVKSNNKLVAFISGVPLNLRVRDNVFTAAEINYLCVHKKLRSKRLAPVLIREVTRQCHLKGVFQAIYTAGVVLPTPVATCRYYHRALNIPKLVDVKFTYVPRSMTLARMIRLHKLPDTPHFSQHARLREMEENDLPEIATLFKRYMQRFDMAPELTLEDTRHHFLSGRGEGESPDPQTNRRTGQVVWSYVVEDSASHKITDFFSFYSLPSTIINDTKHGTVEAAYLFYYATEVAFEDDAEENRILKKRLERLIGDALIVAQKAKFDVFNALTLMDNVSILNDLKFGAGDGYLNFYLYNWRTAPLAGMEPTDNVASGKGVGVVML